MTTAITLDDLDGAIGRDRGPVPRRRAAGARARRNWAAICPAAWTAGHDLGRADRPWRAPGRRGCRADGRSAAGIPGGCRGGSEGRPVAGGLGSRGRCRSANGRNRTHRGGRHRLSALGIRRLPGAPACLAATLRATPAASLSVAGSPGAGFFGFIAWLGRGAIYWGPAVPLAIVLLAAVWWRSTCRATTMMPAAPPGSWAGSLGSVACCVGRGPPLSWKSSPCWWKINRRCTRRSCWRPEPAATPTPSATPGDWPLCSSEGQSGTVALASRQRPFLR